MLGTYSQGARNGEAANGFSCAEYQQLSRRVVAQTLRGSARRFNSDLNEDCQAEALQLLVRKHGKLAALPESERHPFAVVCIRRATCRVLRREIRQRRNALSLDMLCDSIDAVDEGSSEYILGGETLYWSKSKTLACSVRY
jgi:hypothetical protein